MPTRDATWLEVRFGKGMTAFGLRIGQCAGLDERDVSANMTPCLRTSITGSL